MFWKPSLPDRGWSRRLVLLGMGLACYGASSLVMAQKDWSVEVLTNGVPVPFATVANVSAGTAVAANAFGIALLEPWAPTDTLRVQSLGHDDQWGVPGSATTWTVDLLSTTFAIEEVVVQSSAVSSSATAAMAGADLTRMVARAPVRTTETTGDLLESSGQIHLQMSQQGGISPVLRGFEANRVLLVVDGVRMNNAIYRSGHVQNAGSIDPFAVVRTDVLMGPSSVLYGSDALGGVVHFMTKAPRFGTDSLEAHGQFTTQGSTVNGGWAGHAEVTVQAPRWGSVTQVTRRAFGDLKMGSWRAHGDSTWGLVPFTVVRQGGKDTLVANADPTLQVATAYDQWDFQHRMRAHWKGGFIDLNLQHSTTGDVPRFDVYNDMAGGTTKWAEWAYGPQQRSLAALTLQRAVAERWTWTTLASVQRIEESRIKRRFGSDMRTVQRESLLVGGLTSVLRGRVGEWKMEAGADGQWNAVESTARFEDLASGLKGDAWTRYADGGSTMSTWGAFASAHVERGQHAFRGGLRYSHASVHSSFEDTTRLSLPFGEVNQQGGALTASGAWTGKVSTRGTWATSLSSGFRHPNVDDLGKVREKAGFVLVPNPDLRPEYLYTAEQGLTWSCVPNSDVLVLRAAVFGSLWDDAIVQTNASMNGDTLLTIDGDTARIQMNQNIDRAWVRGARLEGQARLGPRATLRGVVNWTLGNSLEQSAQPLAHIPPTFGLLEWVQTHPRGRWSTTVRYALPKRAEDYGPGATDNLQEALPQGSPAWATWNVSGSWQMNDALEIRVAAMNLLDLHYRTFGSGLSAPGRNLRLTATAQF